MHKIALICGGYTTVDAEDFVWLNRHSWTNVNGYAARIENGRTIYMHREIMQSPSGIQVDHKNGNKLDNTRKNLRHATPKQNAANRPGWGSSPYKGVYRQGNKWRAMITQDGKLRSLGSYGSARDAAIAYNAAAMIVHGEFALLNNI